MDQKPEESTWPLWLIGGIVGAGILGIGPCAGVFHEKEPEPPPLPVFGSGGGYVRDLDCADVGGPTVVGDYDPNGFDADGDGIGCE